MNREGVLDVAAAKLRREFGTLVEIRELRRVRRVSGDTWSASVVCVASAGDVAIGQFEVSDEGAFTPALTADLLIDTLRRSFASPSPAANGPDPFASAPMLADDGASLTDGSLTEGLGDEDVDAMWSAIDELGESSEAKTPDAIYRKALDRGDRGSLRRARDQLPQFLADAETRGTTLLHMAEIEQRLEEVPIAIGYLEAASREFANRFDMVGLENGAAIAKTLMGDRFAESSIGRLLEQNRLRLNPVRVLGSAPLLRGLPVDQISELAKGAELRTLAKGDMLVREGEPSRAVFVIKSGVLAVLLEAQEGGTRLVRCCYPGLLLGESSVLLDNPKCSASLRAETASEVWALDAQVVKRVMATSDTLKVRVESTKYMHRIDSFFSMHESLSQLEPSIRDEILACLHSIEPVEEDRPMVRKGDIPEIICLVARGDLALFDKHEPGPTDTPAITLSTDAFFGFRDGLHGIPSERTAVARRGSIMITFDAAQLRAMVDRYDTHVAHVLERLG